MDTKKELRICSYGFSCFGAVFHLSFVPIVMPLDCCCLGQLAMFGILTYLLLFLCYNFFDYDLMLRSTITNYDF